MKPMNNALSHFACMALTALMLLSSNSVRSQDTVTIMTYNLLNFPNVAPERVDTLKKILQYFNPDILLVNELNNNTGANTILTGALNVDGVTSYRKAVYITSGSSDVLCYYDTNKVLLASQKSVATSLRDIGEYVLYHKSADLATTADTAFIYAYSLHLKAGSDASDENQREDEANSLFAHIDGRGRAENIIVGGDFNIYRSSEAAFGILTQSGNNTLEDPINRIGDWHNSPGYADIHTQSTRTNSINGGAGGGMDDRFDFFLVTNDVMTGSNGVKIVPGSYEAPGQDGNRRNGTLLSPTNTTYPGPILSALYYMSDHLPVIMKLQMGAIADINEVDSPKGLARVFAIPGSQLVVHSKSESPYSQLQLLDLSGKVILEESLHTGQQKFQVPGDSNLFIARLLGEGAIHTSLLGRMH